MTMLHGWNFWVIQVLLVSAKFDKDWVKLAVRAGGGLNEAVVLLPATLGGGAFGGTLSIQVEMGSWVALLILEGADHDH